MKLRSKMLVLAGVVFLGFLSSTLMGLYIVNEVRVGGTIYQTIKNYKDLLEQIAILKSDLNQVRAETLNLILENEPDKLTQIQQNLDYLGGAINDSFDQVLATVRAEEKRIALQDAQGTWQEFSATLNSELLPLVLAGDQEEAHHLADGVQRQRYERFLDQVSGMVDLLTLEIEELEESAAVAVRSKALLSAGVSGVIFVIILLATLLITRAITRPLLKGVAFAQSVAGGDLSALLEVRGRDEIADLTGALNTMVQGLNGLVQRVGQSSAELMRISGNIFDTSRRVVDAAQQQAGSVEETSSAVTEINSSIREVGQEVGHLSESAAENTSSILEMAASIDEVAQNVETLAQSVEEVSSSIAEMTASIRQVAASAVSLQEASDTTSASIAEMGSSIKQVEQNALSTAAIAEEVRRDAETGKEAVDSSIAGMTEIRDASAVTAEVIRTLSEKAENIGAILSVIDDVVDRINLLALNAAIIAAQAGEHGKGFAVVAGEVKELAERTGVSTREIATVIEGVQEETRKAVQAIRQTEAAVGEGEKLSKESGKRLYQIVSGVEKASRQMHEIARATEEQSRGSQLIGKAMDQIAEMIDQIAGATHQQEKSSELILMETERMKGLTGQVKASTREQSKASGSIAHSTEAMAGMIRQIKRACDEQSKGSEQIVYAAEDIRSATAVNQDATGVLEAAVTDLQQQIGNLQQEMDTFRTMREAPAEA
jgi:methyl-accepting chemotaxis protein